MRKYTFKVKYIFGGDVEVIAKNEEDAREIIRENVWGRNATVADNCCDKITDWGIDCTSDIEVGKKIKNA